MLLLLLLLLLLLPLLLLLMPLPRHRPSRGAAAGASDLNLTPHRLLPSPLLPRHCGLVLRQHRFPRAHRYTC